MVLETASVGPKEIDLPKTFQMEGLKKALALVEIDGQFYYHDQGKNILYVPIIQSEKGQPLLITLQLVPPETYLSSNKTFLTRIRVGNKYLYLDKRTGTNYVTRIEGEKLTVHILGEPIHQEVRTANRDVIRATNNNALKRFLEDDGIPGVRNITFEDARSYQDELHNGTLPLLGDHHGIHCAIYPTTYKNYRVYPNGRYHIVRVNPEENLPSFDAIISNSLLKKKREQATVIIGNEKDNIREFIS